MNVDRNREYLEAKVQTASPAQLHLMLIDGALRFGREAERGLLRGDEGAYQTPLLRTMDVVEELLVGVRSGDSEINEKLAQLYTFVYARLTSVYVNADHRLMGEALQVLEFQRETWRLAVEKITREAGAAVAESPKAPAPKPHLGALPAAQGLSLEV